MGAHPKKKISNVQQATRRAAKQLTLQQLSRCSHCQAPTVPHIVCKECGYYKGKPVVVVK